MDLYLQHTLVLEPTGLLDRIWTDHNKGNRKEKQQQNPGKSAFSLVFLQSARAVTDKIGLFSRQNNLNFKNIVFRGHAYRTSDRYGQRLSISTNEKIITEHLIIQKIRDRGRTTTHTCLWGKMVSCPLFTKLTHP